MSKDEATASEGKRKASAEDAVAKAKRHFYEEKSEDIFERARDIERKSPAGVEDVQAEASAVLELFPADPNPQRIPLSAYFACALTGLSEEERREVFHLADIVAEVCLELNIDLYEPRKQTDPVAHPWVSSDDVFQTDRERVLESDLLVHLTHFPSTGAGLELDFAYGALLPILLISRADKPVSRMIKGIPGLKVELTYTNPDELYTELRRQLLSLRPTIEERKLAFEKYKENFVGTRIRELRESLGMTRESLAQSLKTTPEVVAQLEDSHDLTSNPTLLLLRQLATGLRTTAAELIAPDFSDLVVAELISWLDQGRLSARFRGMSGRDQSRLLRRLLLRVLDQLERQDS